MSPAARALLLPAALSVLVAAGPLPGPTPVADRIEARDPIITPAVNVDWRALRGKRALSDLTAEIVSDVDSVLSGLGSDLPSWVASGIPQYFEGLPTGDAVASSLGIGSSELAAVPTNVLNIDPYANYTDQGWNVRFHGNVYKQPNTSNETLDKLAGDLFIYGEDFSNLTASEQAMARNLTAEIFVVQQGNVAVNTIHLEPAPSQGSSGEPGGGGSSNTTGGTQDITLPYNTTAEGDFDVFVPIASNGLTAGNETSKIQRLNTYVEGASIGNSTAYLVPDEGLTVISDIDDILRVTKIYEPEQGLLNSFARPFTPWEDMPSIYANWSSSIDGIHFHYLTTTPEQVTRNYMQFIYSTYPGGSFDTRPLNFSDVSETLSVRKYLLIKVFETFPKRKFVLVADTSNSDVMRDYPEMATLFPGQVQCIFLRNTTSTDPGDKFPYDTSGFKGLNQDMYMFFKNADDLTNLDIASGQCYNTSIAQNVTFSTQGLPFGLSSTTSTNGSANGSSTGSSKSGAGTHSSSLSLIFFGFLSVLFWQLL